VSRVAEEPQLCSCWPKSHESVVMHELAHRHDGGTWSCFSTTEVFSSWHFLLDVSALRDNTSNSLFAGRKNSWRITPSMSKKKKNHRDLHVRPDPPHLFWTRENFFQPIVMTALSFTHRIHKPMFHHRTFSSLLVRSKSSWQMTMRLSLWSCQKLWDKLWN
jgi:hypothetical protein